MFEALGDLIAYRLLGLENMLLGAAVQFFVMDVAKILVLLTLVIYVMGLLRALLKPEKVREFIRNRGNLQSRFLGGRPGRGDAVLFLLVDSAFHRLCRGGYSTGRDAVLFDCQPDDQRSGRGGAGLGHRLEIHHPVCRHRSFRGVDRRFRARTLQARALGGGRCLENPHG